MSASKADPFDIAKKFEPLTRLLTEGLPFLEPELDDTALVLISTSLIDQFLQMVLVSGFHADRASNTLVDAIFTGDGPLSRFSDKIALCTALNLLRDDVRHDLTVMRKIRNEFAHAPKRLRLQDFPAVTTLKVTSKFAIEDGDLCRLKFKKCVVGTIGSLGQYSMMHIAKGRFIDKNKDGVMAEFILMQREADSA